jgi:hypothetical protein
LTPLDVLPWLLVAQGVVGGFDTLFNHELLAGLPRRPGAHAEIGLHTLREAIYAMLFGGLAWLAWQGAAAWVIAALVAAELVVSARDELEENRIRVLPQNERVVHVLLTLNLGAIIALLVPVLRQWHGQPTGFQPTGFGALSWILTALAAAALAWSIRDFRAWRRLRRAAGVTLAPRLA